MAKDLAPHPVKLGERSVAWIEDELEAWMHQLRTQKKVGDRLNDPCTYK
jgi:predicted DNA-binding transcriptional regulator AlpA